jgi:hypothetical protein
MENANGSRLYSPPSMLKLLINQPQVPLSVLLFICLRSSYINMWITLPGRKEALRATVQRNLKLNYCSQVEAYLAEGDKLLRLSLLLHYLLSLLSAGLSLSYSSLTFPSSAEPSGVPWSGCLSSALFVTLSLLNSIIWNSSEMKR